MASLAPYLPFLIPLAVMQLGLTAASLIHVLRHKTYRFGNTVFWVVVCLVFEIIGAVVYFAIGKGDE